MSNHLSLFRMDADFMFRIQSASFTFRLLPTTPVDHLGILPDELVVFDNGMAPQQVNPPMLRMCQMLSHPYACHSAPLANVRSATVSEIDGISYACLFMWVAWILEADLKGPFPLMSVLHVPACLNFNNLTSRSNTWWRRRKEKGAIELVELDTRQRVSQRAD